MPIIAYDEINTLMQTSGYDTEIKQMIPIVQSDIVDYCKNNFLNGRVYVVGSGIAFVHNASSADQITDSDEQFVDNYFYTGMDIYVDGSYNNDGIYGSVSTVAAGTLTLSYDNTFTNPLETLVNEDTGERIISIICVKFPKALKLTVAKMIFWNLQKKGLKGLKSFHLADYSETYEDLGWGGYPKALLNGLNKYRCTRKR